MILNLDVSEGFVAERKQLMKIYKTALLVLSCMLACFTSISIIASPDQAIHLIALVPLAFVLSCPLLICTAKLGKESSITFDIVSALLVVRYVITPSLSFWSGYYGELFDTYGNQVLYQSCMSMLIELMAVVILCFILFSRTPQNAVSSKSGEITLVGFSSFYYLLGIVAVIIVIMYGNRLNINFLSISVGSGERIDESLSTSDQLLSQLANSGLTFLFLAFAMKCMHGYEIINKKKYVVFATIAALLFTCVLFGERRSGIVYTCFASVIVLISLFPSYRESIIKAMLIVVIIVVGLMSVYKVSYAFLYESYFAALADTDFDFLGLARSFDAYFGGIGNIAENITYLEKLDLGIENFIFDITRSTFGLNVLLRGFGSTISEIYNSFIYSGAQSTGHLITSASYGAIFVGPIFGSLATLVNIAIAYFLERAFLRVRSIELMYIFSYIYIRFALGIFTSIPPLISLSTRVLFINLIIIYVAKLLNKNGASNYVGMPKMKSINRS